VKPIYIGRFWVTVLPSTCGQRWFTVLRPGRGIYITIKRFALGWA
jgi:hypothetical protein